MIDLSYMFGATGRSDDVEVITGLPTPKTNSMPLFVWLNCAFVYL